MTTAPARPRFTQDARGHYPCPAPTCRQTFTRPQGVSRHWNQQHGTPADTNGHRDESDPFDPASLAALYEEVGGTVTHGDDQDDDIMPAVECDPTCSPDTHLHCSPQCEHDCGCTQTPPAIATVRQHGAGVEDPGEAVEESPSTPPARPGTTRTAYRDRWATLFGTSPATAAGIHLLTPEQATRRVDHALALSDAVAGLVDATIRLAAVPGMGPARAAEVVLGLVHGLDGRPA